MATSTVNPLRWGELITMVQAHFASYPMVDRWVKRG